MLIRRPLFTVTPQTPLPSPERMAEHVAQPDHRQESHQLTVPNPPAQPLEWDRTGPNASPWAHEGLGSCSALPVRFARRAGTPCTGNLLAHARAAAPALLTDCFSLPGTTSLWVTGELHYRSQCIIKKCKIFPCFCLPSSFYPCISVFLLSCINFKLPPLP